MDLSELSALNKETISEPRLSLTVPGSLIRTSLLDPKLATWAPLNPPSTNVSRILVMFAYSG